MPGNIRKIVSKLRSLAALEATIQAQNTILLEKLDEDLQVSHLVKNGSSVKTGEFEALTRLFTGQLMYVDTRDVSVTPHLLMSGVWEEPITKVFRAILKKDDIIIDAGANFGYFGIVAGSTTSNESKILFIEANPALIPYIKKSVAVNGLPRRAFIECVAISDKPGTAKFTFLADAWGSSSLFDLETISKGDGIDYALQKTIKVPVETIDALVTKHNIVSADILKLDVEGVEPEAYAGAKKLIKNSPNLKMLIEFTPGRYKDAKKFFNTVKKDFPYIYRIGQPNGELHKVDTYDNLSFKKDTWAMLLVAKKKVTLH